MNPFEALAEAQIPAPVKARAAAVERRRARAAQAERDLRDEQILLKSYRAWKRAKRDALLSGPHRREVRGLIRFIESMTLSSAPALIALIERAAWIRTMTADERHDLFGIVARGITRCREKAGLPPFDDEIPWMQEPKAASRIKAIMEVW